MAKKGGSSQPATPDPVAMAAAQGSANRDTAVAQARLNQTDEFTPYGSSVYNPIGDKVDGIQRFSRTTTLAPDQQAILDQQTGISRDLNSLAQGQIGRIQNAVSTPFSYDGMPAAPVANEQSRQQVIDALFGQAKSRLDPMMEQQRTALETRLANQGIDVGNKAYSTAMQDFGRTQNDAYGSALNQAIAAGGSEQSRLFGLEGSARERAIQEAAYLRNQPLNELAAFTGAAPSVQTPQFSPTPQTAVAPTDLSAGYALQQAALNRQQGANNAAMGGLFGLAGSGLQAAAYGGLFSDRRLKTNVKRVGTMDNGLPIYTYDYLWGGKTQMGVMADEVEKVIPEAVGQRDGFKTVNYGML